MNSGIKRSGTFVKKFIPTQWFREACASRRTTASLHLRLRTCARDLRACPGRFRRSWPSWLRWSSPGASRCRACLPCGAEQAPPASAKSFRTNRLPAGIQCRCCRTCGAYRSFREWRTVRQYAIPRIKFLYKLIFSYLIK